MIRKLLLAAGLTALATLPLHAQDSASVARAINDLEAQWGVSLAAANWTAVASFLAPGYMVTDGTGKRIDRATYLAGLQNDVVKYSDVKNGPYTVIVNGTTAVHLGEGTLTTTTKKGRVSHIRTIWTDTWVRMPNGQWLCIAGQFVETKVKK
jgi:ketosteroid isomerase-like protein